MMRTPGMLLVREMNIMMAPRMVLGALLALAMHIGYSAVSGTTINNSTRQNVIISTLLPYDPQWLFAMPRVREALNLAVEEVTSSPNAILKCCNLILDYRDSQCRIDDGMNEAINAFVTNTVHVFFGPCCDYSAAPVGRQVKFWKIPLITAGALSSDFAKKDMYALVTRIGPNFNSLLQFIFSMFNEFAWRRVTLMYDPDGQEYIVEKFCHIAANAIHSGLRERKHGTDFEEEHFKISTNESIASLRERLVTKIGNNHAVIILCASPNTVREIMIQAHELNFDNGEYVFFSIDLFDSHNMTGWPWYRENDTEARNKKARQAYEALMSLTLRKPTSPEYRKFSELVKKRAEMTFPNFTYGEDEVNNFVGAFHDAVILYALALNETLEAGGTVKDGAEITRRMWNRTFQGITGTVSIDENGDRNADYSLLDLNPAKDRFEIVANFYGNRKMYEPVEGKEIHWAGGKKGPPPDEPQCGFDGSKCPPHEPFPEYAIVILVLGSLLLVVLFITLLVYRHLRLEAELAAMNWRVRWDELLFGNPTKNFQLENRRNSASTVSGDTIAAHLGDTTNRQLFTKTCYYKGAILSVKMVSRQHISITKPLLLEIKRIKDLQNDHLVRFHGICIDPPHQCILTEYCPKGSLQDVLENEQIKLDWMFRYSIMQDIVRGMAYLHSTEIRSHGNLKSTNCVVDSRFVVKITDFGLHYFREREEEIEDDSYAHYRNLLWTAPELLRLHNRPPDGTSKGDVYSFAIICQEIVYRHGVFYLHNLDVAPKEICDKARDGVKPYFRPTLENYDCPCDELAGVIRRCWAEDPAERPDFQALRTLIKRLNKDGDKGDILDNLLSRMEQYANNLEALVEERTSDYLEQKRRAEDLLYSMLPKQVAGQLIRGEVVKAENFESVTIYFSDICGFTALSAESTPMQVVDLLNDLYTTFDSILENYDVYKVETIGDAYMVVSGLPIRNGNLHAREIARMSLSLLNAVKSFKIRHRPADQLRLRIGIHTGPVCAGVVGLKMPRYCLFGDTVNTSSRMESNGLPLKIHVSPQTKEVLDMFGNFETELRGDVEMKGKGVITTFWLLGEKGGLSVR